MVESPAYPQNRRNPHLTQNFWMSNEPERTYAVPRYKQHTQSQGYYHGHQINKRYTHTPLNRSPHEYSVPDAQVGAYEDAVTMKAWYDEWEVEPDDFGTPRPLLILNRPANIDLRNHAWRTKLIYLCHWDQGHEPCGVIAQCLADAKLYREKEPAGAYMGSEQDIRRKRVKQAARNAEVIDLTGDDTVGESKFWSHVGIENVENYLPGTMAQPWRI